MASVNRRTFLRLLGLAPALPVVAKVAPLLAAPTALPTVQAVDGLFDLAPRQRLDGTIITDLEEDFTRSIRIEPDGSLYIGGHFSRMSGMTCNRIAEWNGITWRALDGDL